MIHSKYFTLSDWLYPHDKFFITSRRLPYQEDAIVSEGGTAPGGQGGGGGIHHNGSC